MTVFQLAVSKGRNELQFCISLLFSMDAKSLSVTEIFYFFNSEILAGVSSLCLRSAVSVLHSYRPGQSSFEGLQLYCSDIHFRFSQVLRH